MFSIANTILLIIILIILLKSGKIVRVEHKYFYQPDTRERRGKGN